MSPDEPVHPEADTEGATGRDDDGWQRLDARMLLIGPADTLRQFAVPLLIALVGIGSSRGTLEPAVVILMLAVPVLLGLLPWLTIRYRITDTQFQQRRGLLSRKQVTAPLERVRSVDLEASLLQRALGLAKVQIGTGVDETRIELNALSVAQAEELRHFLLAQGAPAGGTSSHPTIEPADRAPEPEAPRAELLARIDWSWLRFAPFSLSRLAIVAGAVGVLAQWGENLPFLDAEHLDSAWSWVTGFALTLVIVTALVVVLVAWLVLSVLGYVVQWWGLRLTRERGTIRLAAGLLTTRSTSVEEVRVRGVELIEPALLRTVHGAELSTLATGVGEGGVTKVLPPCPREVCQQVGHAILGDRHPLLDPLVPHGPAARHRAHVRAQWPTVLSGVAVIVAAALLDWPWWVPAATVALLALGGAGTGEAAYRNLGHLLTTDHLTAGDGALQRRRQVLERDGVIGWVIAQSFFQRRRGLATLTATTAAGNERVTVRDVPHGQAVRLATAVTPGAVAPFLREA